MHGDDDGFCRLFADALVGVRRACIKVHSIALLQGALMFAVMETQLTIEEIKELVPWMHVGLRDNVTGDWDELGELGVHVTVWNHVAEALEVIGRLVDAGLRQPYTLLAAMNAEDGVGLGLEEVRQVL